METVNIHAAKTHLSKLLEKVEKGEEFIIARAGKPIARVSPCTASEVAKKPRQGGQWTGKIWYAPDYDQVDGMIQKMFEESEIFPKD
jgi:prevent-host-death family protein